MRPRVVRPTPQRPAERWSIDFVHDALGTGRVFRALTIVDDFTRYCPAIVVDFGLSGERVIATLESLAAERPLPQTLVRDNGPEFTGQALDQWAYARGITLQFIRPGKPIENAYVESFNGRQLGLVLLLAHHRHNPHSSDPSEIVQTSVQRNRGRYRREYLNHQRRLLGGWGKSRDRAHRDRRGRPGRFDRAGRLRTLRRLHPAALPPRGVEPWGRLDPQDPGCRSRGSHGARRVVECPTDGPAALDAYRRTDS